jgi:hypothetical protein
MSQAQHIPSNSEHAVDQAGLTKDTSLPGGTDQTTDVDRYWSKFEAARRAQVHFAWATANDHENAGIYTTGGGNYLGVEAVHTVFKQGDFNLEIPAGAQGAQVLFAPTTRPPNGSCLEMGTAYTTVGAHPTIIYVYVYDFCKSPRKFVYKTAVDDVFLKTYGSRSVDGVWSYKIRIWPADQPKGAQTKWLAQLYNYTQNEWTTVANATGTVPKDHKGWSIFETWYKQGQCSRTLRTIQAIDISYYNTDTLGWQPITNDMTPLHNSLNRGGNCFVDQNANDLASYKIFELQDSHGWQVQGTNH